MLFVLVSGAWKGPKTTDVMKLLEKILLATDFLASSENVVGNAIALAKAFHSRITLIHVLPNDISNEKARKLLKDMAEEHLTRIRGRIEKEDVKTTHSILEWGNPWDNIVQAAGRIHANLILIGAGEQAEGQKFQLGTTAASIIRKSSQPVWVVKPGQPLDASRMLCPVEFSPQSARALRDAIVMARRFEAELTILSVYKPITPGAFSFKYDWEEENTRIAFKHIAQFNEFLKDFNLTDVNWRKEVRRGKPETEILKEIAEKQIGLLVMGATGRSGLSKAMIGSVTEKVTREAPCTFVTTKAKEVIRLELENRIRDIEGHYNIAVQLMKDGFYNESINEFNTCLSINDMHVPSIHGLAKVYEKLGDKEAARRYKELAREVLRRIWDSKIEEEIRRFYTY